MSLRQGFCEIGHQKPLSFVKGGRTHPQHLGKLVPHGVVEMNVSGGGLGTFNLWPVERVPISPSSWFFCNLSYFTLDALCAPDKAYGVRIERHRMFSPYPLSERSSTSGRITTRFALKSGKNCRRSARGR